MRPPPPLAPPPSASSAPPAPSAPLRVSATLAAVIRAAVESTGARCGWILRADSSSLDVVAAYAPGAEAPPLGTRRAVRGVAGFVVGSGQPAAVQLRDVDVDNDGDGGAVCTPRAVLAAPCVAGDVVGVIELVDPAGGAFGFDDVEMVVMLGEIAGAAIDELGVARAMPPTPAQLVERLSTLAVRDPARYADLARFVATVS